MQYMPNNLIMRLINIVNPYKSMVAQVAILLNISISGQVKHKMP